MNKQTAVEWLEEKIKLAKPDFKFDSLIREAKEMEKQQIIDAHNQGYADGYRDNGNSPVDYYNENHGSKI